MCGRYTRIRPWSELVALYRITARTPPPNLPPRYNIAPTQSVPIVRRKDDHDERELALVRWGLLPAWAKDTSISYKMINARAETVDQKPAFRLAFRRRRCLVVADGFYEWRLEGSQKQPYYLTLPANRPFAFAGLWERWRNPEGGDPIESCTIIVCEANPSVRPIHERMPVILEPNTFELWLDTEAELTPIKALLKPCDGPLMAVPVSSRVNNVRNDDPDCLQPIATSDVRCLHHMR
ncbi:SOS response-associated peptidase [Defluviicoccus vanus]|uniref:Abasic site processing protein n=1 Tax=Defluviicoccus vanus TaxID=111831 RepID=A0A7H1N0E9_9PROT|nr:SOS response-associated peptidase [Defluviicoccus vanus]QNT69185.1 SOS response-associated peptidase [Defluviicoccus vanus]